MFAGAVSTLIIQTMSTAGILIIGVTTTIFFLSTENVRGETMSDSNIAVRIKKAQEKLEGIQRETSRAEGSIQAGMKRLLDDFQIKTLEAAETKLEAIEEDVTKLKAALEKELAALEGLLEGDA
jgi:hypothetical protein